MPAMIVKHSVKDFDAWKQVFDELNALRLNASKRPWEQNDVEEG